MLLLVAAPSSTCLAPYSNASLGKIFLPHPYQQTIKAFTSMHFTTQHISRALSLLGAPALALASSKSAYATAPGADNAVIQSATSHTLVGTLDLYKVLPAQSDTAVPMQLTLTPVRWNGDTQPAVVKCDVTQRSASTGTKGGGNPTPYYSDQAWYACTLGNPSATFYRAAFVLGENAWANQSQGITLYRGNNTVPLIELATLPSNSSSKNTSSIRYELNLRVVKTGFSFEDKVNKVIACAERVAGAAFDKNTKKAGASKHYAATETYPEMSVARYESGWQFGVGGPVPGIVGFRTPESAASALSTRTVIDNRGQATIVTDEDMSKGWYVLGSLEDVNREYCKAW